MKYSVELRADLSKQFVEVRDIGSGYCWAVAKTPFTALGSRLHTRVLPFGRAGLWIWTVKWTFTHQLLGSVNNSTKNLDSNTNIQKYYIPSDYYWTTGRTEHDRSTDQGRGVDRVSGCKFCILSAHFVALVPINYTNWIHVSTQATLFVLINVD